jgi:hypothetical protein
MGLSAFIRENIEAILNEWQEFAASIPSAKEMNRAELRNDAQEMLLAIARDIDNSQSREQESQKSKGRQHRLDTSDTAAESHGLARFASGFDIKEMVSEYRALRGSVIRLWVARAPEAPSATLDELTRFNEGMIRRSPNLSCALAIRWMSRASYTRVCWGMICERLFRSS